MAESSFERVVWNESITATRNGAPLEWQRGMSLRALLDSIHSTGKHLPPRQNAVKRSAHQDDESDVPPAARPRHHPTEADPREERAADGMAAAPDQLAC